MNTPNETGAIVLQLLIESGFNVNQAKLVTAQAAHESTNFTSKVFKDHNNCFGMKKADLTDYRTYNNLSECIDDYRAYYVRNGYLNTYLTVEAFVYALKFRKYFEAALDEYTKSVKHFYNLYFEKTL